MFFMDKDFLLEYNNHKRTIFVDDFFVQYLSTKPTINEERKSDLNQRHSNLWDMQHQKQIRISTSIQIILFSNRQIYKYHIEINSNEWTIYAMPNINITCKWLSTFAVLDDRLSNFRPAVSFSISGNQNEIQLLW